MHVSNQLKLKTKTTACVLMFSIRNPMCGEKMKKDLEHVQDKVEPAQGTATRV